MMTNKKLSTIREEIRASLSSGGQDPIAWLEEQIALKKRDGDGGEEAFKSLKRVLEGGSKKPKRKPPIRAK